MSTPNTGTVYLVGAGPGDPELLTLKALRLLKGCDAVLYDHLADASLLELAPASAERLYVGKTGAHKGADARQASIHDLLIERAQAGLNVVRLKGGDPFVFGRGGEEAQALRAAGIRFEVVPGITSAIAVPAYAGIPVTHRNFNTALAIVTGHEDPRLPSSRTNWKALASFAAAGGTLVILMGVKNLARNMDFLMGCGVDAETPVAMVRWGTRPDQRAILGTVSTIAALKDTQHLRPPAVTIVGPVASLRNELAWFDAGPLGGQRVLITRDGPKSAQMASDLRALGASPVVLPTLEVSTEGIDTAALDEALNDLGRYGWVVWTSANGVRTSLTRLFEGFGADARALAGCRLACVGAATAKALADFGLKPDFVPQKATASALARQLLDEHGPSLRQKPVLALLAEAARPDLPQMLRAGEVQLDVVVPYRTAAPEQWPIKAMEALLDGQLDVVTFMSPSAIRHLEHMVAPQSLSKAVGDALVACVGPVTAQTAAAHGLAVGLVPEVHSAQGLLQSLVQRQTPSNNA